MALVFKATLIEIKLPYELRDGAGVQGTLIEINSCFRRGMALVFRAL